MKSEPETYPIEKFEKDKKTLWTGVRNYLARNFMMSSMQVGDRFLFYHSNAEPSAVTGFGKILRTNVPDPTAYDKKDEYHDPKSTPEKPIWFCAEVGFEKRFKKPVTLEDIKATKALSGMALLQKGQRLSIQQVSQKDFELILKMGGV